MKSVVSRIVVAGVAIGAAAGWAGVETSPAVNAHAAPVASAAAGAGETTGVRNRAAWQPSPVPSTHSTTATTSSSTAANAAAVQAQAQPAAPSAPAAGVRDRSAWQPSPIPSTQQAQAKAQAKAQDTTAPAAAVPVVAPQPAPVAGVASPLGGLADWLKGLFGRRPAPDAVEETVEPIRGAESVIPLAQAFNHDALEQVFADSEPHLRGEWRFQSFYSPSLGREDTYMAWVPPDYATSGRRYPTLYLLHGVGSPEAYGAEEWLGYALTEDLDRMMSLGLIEPMIVVLPNGGQGYWINHADGGPRWGDYVARDLVKHVDATLRTEARREKRAVGGLSMGAHGALQLAYNHPDVFSIAGAHSPTIRPFETSPEFFGDPKWFAKHDPVSLARGTNAPLRVLSWIDVGQDDEWRAGAMAVAQALAAKRAPYEYRVFEGEHEGWYWKYYLPEYLHFYSSALYATEYTPAGAPVVKTQLLTAGVTDQLQRS
jgi:enterochelin esterase-like enzyme